MAEQRQTGYPVEVIAKLFDVTPRRVQQLSASGVIPKAAHGRYELGPTVQAYVRHLRARADAGGEIDYGSERARLTRAKANIAELEAERVAGTLVEVDEVEKAWTDTVARFRARALAVPSKAAPLVAVEPTIEACHEIIETYVHEALAELAAVGVDGREPADPSDEGGPQDGGPASETDGEPVG